MFADALQASFEISIHALRKESDLDWAYPSHPRQISIHALRKESDSMLADFYTYWQDFNPRSP